MAGTGAHSICCLFTLVLYSSVCIFEINKYNVQCLFYNNLLVFNAETVASSKADLEAINPGTPSLQLTVARVPFLDSR